MSIAPFKKPLISRWDPMEFVWYVVWSYVMLTFLKLTIYAHFFYHGLLYAQFMAILLEITSYIKK